MGIFDFFKKKEPEKEIAAVRAEKLTKWVELQYRPLLLTTLERLKTNVNSLHEYAPELKLNLDEIQKFEMKDQKIHILNLFLEHKKYFLQSANRLISFLETQAPSEIIEIKVHYKKLEENLLVIANMQKKVGHTLAQYVHDPYRKMTGLIFKIQKNHQQSNEILESREYRQYMSAIQLVDQYFAKLKEQEDLFAKRDNANKVLKKHVILLQKSVERQEKLGEDPRFKLETQSVQNNNSRYGHSYYGLEMEDIQDKIDQQIKQVEIIKKHIAKLQTQIRSIGVDDVFAKLNKKLNAEFSIEVELVESD